MAYTPDPRGYGPQGPPSLEKNEEGILLVKNYFLYLPDGMVGIFDKVGLAERVAFINCRMETIWDYHLTDMDELVEKLIELDKCQ